MAAISISINLKDVLAQLGDKLKLITNPEYLLKPAAEEAITLIHPRIHVDGKASDGGQIGEYSEGYLRLRQGIFKNSERVTRGINKGKVKGPGTFSKGEKIGQARPRFPPRGDDPKVIISLTRQLENDYAIVAVEKGYGVGFNNSFNYDKSQFVEATYNKRIFALTVEEQEKIKDLIHDKINEAFKGPA